MFFSLRFTSSFTTNHSSFHQSLLFTTSFHSFSPHPFTPFHHILPLLFTTSFHSFLPTLFNSISPSFHPQSPTYPFLRKNRFFRYLYRSISNLFGCRWFENTTSCTIGWYFFVTVVMGYFITSSYKKVSVYLLLLLLLLLFLVLTFLLS